MWKNQLALSSFDTQSMLYCAVNSFHTRNDSYKTVVLQNVCNDRPLLRQNWIDVRHFSLYWNFSCVLNAVESTAILVNTYTECMEHKRHRIIGWDCVDEANHPLIEWFTYRNLYASFVRWAQLWVCEWSFSDAGWKNQNVNRKQFNISIFQNYFKKVILEEE